MHEFWLKDKLILLIGLFQFGLVLIVMAAVNLVKMIWGRQNIVDTNSPNEIANQTANQTANVAIASNSLSEVESEQLTKQVPNDLKDEVSNLSNHQNQISHDPALVNLNESDRIDLLEQQQLEANALNCKVDIDPELLTELKEISNDPTAIIDEAIRWWLRRRTLEVLDASDDRPYRMGMRSSKSKRSSQDLWND
ncbi:MAG: hypothetical protein ACOYN8_15175 [Pseudanabaena sp.]